MRMATAWALVFCLFASGANAQDVVPTEDPKGEAELEQQLEQEVLEAAPPEVIENTSAEVVEATPESLESPPVSQEVQKRDGDNRTYIQHPMAAKGLRLIDRDGSYYYTPYRRSRNERSSALRLGPLQPHPSITSQGSMTNYGLMYGEQAPITLMFDYEWKPWQGFGSLGLQVGAGLFTAQGQGVFTQTDTTPQAQNEAREKFTFFAIPINAGVVYRFEFFDNQWFAPYVMGGGSIINFMEMRDDDKLPSLAFTPAVYAGGGFMINISALDRDVGFNLDTEYGIGTMWLTGEIRQIQVTNKELDVSGTLVSFGFAMDY